MNLSLRDVVIVAVHNTRQAKQIDEPEDSLMLGAFRTAMAEAGIGPADIDGVSAHGWTSGTSGLDVIAWLGGHPCWNGVHYPGIASVMEAAGAILAGQCHTVLMGAAQSGAHRDRTHTAPWTRPENEFVGCWGMMTPAQFALIAQRHIALYGTPLEALAEVASSIRSNGACNPAAVFYREGQKVTREDVLASRMIAEPFHLLDCAMTSEGGSALIMTTRERARDMGGEPVHILAGALERMGDAYKEPPVWDRFGMMGQRAAKGCFDRAGLTPADVDFCEFYDPFSFEIIRQLEAYGFCKPGEAAGFVLDGNIRINGSLPVVTNGGLMSFSHAGAVQNLQKVIAGVQQLRGLLPAELTVKGAQVAMISNNGSAAVTCDVMLLGKDA
jgi:acetyl-CoA acetyltransferase